MELCIEAGDSRNRRPGSRYSPDRCQAVRLVPGGKLDQSIKVCKHPRIDTDGFVKSHSAMDDPVANRNDRKFWQLAVDGIKQPVHECFMGCQFGLRPEGWKQRGHRTLNGQPHNTSDAVDDTTAEHIELRRAENRKFEAR
jgi:hypothetical protein